ncbi:MAG: hypothetical protein ACREIW_07650 [Chthoniobacterales bacterium]
MRTRTPKSIVTSFAIVAGWMALSLSVATATTITFGDIHDLGIITPNHPADPSDSATYTTFLKNMSPSTTFLGGPGGNDFIRTANFPTSSSFANAVFDVELSFTISGNTATVTLPSTGDFYLLGKYDGPNFGSEVWVINGLTGTITMPEFGSGDQFGLSHVYVFNPGSPGGVPDGGSTLMLLGSALGGAGLMRRFFSR